MAIKEDSFHLLPILKSASLGTCLKNKAEMWLTIGMRGLHKVRQVRIMLCCGNLLEAFATTLTL